MRIRLFIVSSLFLLLPFFFSSPIFAENKTDPLPAITIINPLRGNELGHESDDLAESLKAQWQITKEAEVNATWLWQYGALENDEMTNFAKSQMPNQEFGIWLEIDRNHAQKAGVLFRGQGPWYFSDGLLLSSYDVADRKKLVDTVFAKFKETFGYYPKTVGSWWVGADSLVYMQKKYGITASLKASDQFDLDKYSIWGAPWSIPYVASAENQAIPANSWTESSKVVMLQWAARDPSRGLEDPLYSVQDFPARGIDFSYIDYMASIFLRKQTDNLVFGLENGGTLETFGKYYEKIVKKARELEKNKKAKVMLVSEYVGQFLSKQETFGATRHFLTKDFLNDDQSFWYHSVNYRVGIKKTDNKIYLIDLHDYRNKVQEDFAILPNSQAILRVDSPAVVDSMRFPEQKRLITQEGSELRIKEVQDSVVLYAGQKKIAHFSSNNLKIVNDSDDKLFEVFSPKNKGLLIDISLLLFGIFVIYFLFILFQSRNTKQAMIQIFILSIPLFFASPFLSQGRSGELTLLFDKKALFLLGLIGNKIFLFEQFLIIVFQIFPLLILFLSHYLFIFILKKRQYVYFFVGISGLVTLFYIHTPYFPLDRSTYPAVLLCFGLLIILFIAISYLVFKKNKSKKKFGLALASIPVIIVLLGGMLLISRTKYAVTPFERDALRVIAEKKKDVLVVVQEGGVNPIYKAVRPAFYNNYALAEKLTEVKWQVVMRPTTHVLSISNYENNLILVPRYLGSDLSPFEIKNLQLNKIFDNAQIDIYEKK